MANGSRLHRIGNLDKSARATIVFVHGLAGHPFDTWRLKEKAAWGDDPTFWPHWLREDLERVNTYSLEYPADILTWTGNAMPLLYRARNVLEHMLVEPDALRPPVFFICHSLGGLVIKQVIRQADAVKNARPEAAAFLKSIGGVIFMATPHAGASLATTVSYFRAILKVSSAVGSLIEDDPTLIDLKQWYSDWADQHRVQCKHRVFRETQAFKGITAVAAGTADPGLVDTTIVPVDANHFSVCKPADRDALVYKSVRSFLSTEIAQRPLAGSGA